MFMMTTHKKGNLHYIIFVFEVTTNLRAACGSKSSLFILWFLNIFFQKQKQKSYINKLVNKKMLLWCCDRGQRSEVTLQLSFLRLFCDSFETPKKSPLASAPNHTKTQHFTVSTSAFPRWFCQWSAGIKMLSPWETPLKLSLCVIYTENKVWAKNHRECLFKHNSRGPWKMIKASSLFVNTHMFRKKKRNSFKMEPLPLILCSRYNRRHFLTND